MAQIGKPIDRVEAFLKVTGTAKYAAEFNPKNMAYGFPVRATIGKGSITSFDTDAAQKSKGVIKILTHENAPRLRAIDPQALRQAGALPGENLATIQDNKVFYFGQYIAVVIAETYEQARAAASLIKVAYNKETPAIDLKTELPNGIKPEKNMGEDAQINEGKTAGIIDAAPVKIENTYITPTENHHPMEPHATNGK